ncbi:TPA: hypothetical protein ACH3X2_003817 [Trebouxia sp. C0005]
MLRDNRLKTDVDSARFMSSEPASFFAELLVRPLGVHNRIFRAVCLLLTLLLRLLHCIMSEQQLVLHHALASIDVYVCPEVSKLSEQGLKVSNLLSKVWSALCWQCSNRVWTYAAAGMGFLPT